MSAPDHTQCKTALLIQVDGYHTPITTPATGEQAFEQIIAKVGIDNVQCWNCAKEIPMREVNEERVLRSFDIDITGGIELGFKNKDGNTTTHNIEHARAMTCSDTCMTAAKKSLYTFTKSSSTTYCSVCDKPVDPDKAKSSCMTQFCSPDCKVRWDKTSQHFGE